MSEARGIQQDIYSRPVAKRDHVQSFGIYVMQFMRQWHPYLRACALLIMVIASLESQKGMGLEEWWSYQKLQTAPLA